MTSVYRSLPPQSIRKTSQFLMPDRISTDLDEEQHYQIYPSSKLGPGKIFNGYASLADFIISQGNVMIDGYAGVFWSQIKERLDSLFSQADLEVNWIEAADYLKGESQIQDLVSPFLGSGDSVWGTRTTLGLADLFTAEIYQQKPQQAAAINIIIGTGAALAGWDTPLIYIDLPKNELQFRMRAGSICNLGSIVPERPADMYKRFYFVDWVMLNDHKRKIQDQITVFADGQWTDVLTWCFATDLRYALQKMSRSVIRVRPWFEPGAWGGQWMKRNIRNLNTDVVNLAWSFELIVPENGLVFESDGNLLEVSFDTLMFNHAEEVLGKHVGRFGTDFPIRFDFLDTVQGGNLSIQCHPKLEYIREHFGEKITQDETYYILDCEENAKVYLGFQSDIDPLSYRRALEDSQSSGQELEIEKYVQSHRADKHDLFLIPNGTVHSAGAGNLVLEISATPYIFTFKMYDWQRLDLDGKPRPINIEHAFNNLDFECKGTDVADHLISKPVLISASSEQRLIHLPTTSKHFYDVHRLEFDHSIDARTNGLCHVMMVVEGGAVLLETADGTKRKFAYAETFVIPAAAESYRLVNLGKERTKVIKAFLK